MMTRSHRGNISLVLMLVLMLGLGLVTPSIAHAFDTASVKPTPGSFLGDDWTQHVAQMSAGRSQLGIATLDDGRVLVTGGECGKLKDCDREHRERMRETQLWDPETNEWSDGPAMLHPRSQHGMVTMTDGRVMVIGGLVYDQAGHVTLLASMSLWPCAWHLCPPAHQ
jgi:hypothetical protein